ncbi:MAG TPA: hypothetical protein VM936_03860 [Pyrinomonadaceae bacterium]|jgi:hypothetical protein|nr:hypothetical protein [Pyrinomonadaceae bacterium]
MAELFERVEINRAPRWPLMTRLLALSVVAHGVFLVAVVYVPTLRSMLALAGSMSGINVVSEDYDKTLIGQRATIVQLGPHEKLRYPPDYFGAPAVEETAQLQPQFIQPAAPPPPPMPTYRPRRVRIPRTRAVTTPTPAPEVAQVSPTPTPDPAEKQKAETDIDKIVKDTGVKRPDINKKPFEDFASEAKKLYDEGKVDLNSAVEVNATGPVMEDGTLDPALTKLEWVSAQNENNAKLAQMLLTAISQSKTFANLEGAKVVTMSLKLDQDKISINILSDLPTEADAKTKAEAYAGMVFLAKLARSGTNEGELYKGLKFNYEGKQFKMSFEMPRDAAGKILGEVLAKQAAAAQNKT